MDSYITVDLVKLFLEYAGFSMIIGVAFIIFFELMLLGIVKAFHLLKL